MVEFRRSDDAPSPLDTGRRRGVTRVKNADAVRGLVEYRSLEIGKRFFRVAPIRYEDGFELQALVLAVKELYDAPADTGSHAEYQRVVKEGAKMARRLLIPTTPRSLGKWLWLLFRRRPFNRWYTRRLTESDIFTLLDFFWRCRMASTVHIRHPKIPSGNEP